MDALTHQRIKSATQHTRNTAAQERRANGWGYRKIAVNVEVLDMMDAAGEAMVLATSNVPAEQGRYFRVVAENGRWRCACGAFRSLGGCHRAGHLAASAGLPSATLRAPRVPPTRTKHARAPVSVTAESGAFVIAGTPGRLNRHTARRAPPPKERRPLRVNPVTRSFAPGRNWNGSGGPPLRPRAAGRPMLGARSTQTKHW